MINGIRSSGPSAQTAEVLPPPGRSSQAGLTANRSEVLPPPGGSQGDVSANRTEVLPPPGGSQGQVSTNRTEVIPPTGWRQGGSVSISAEGARLAGGGSTTEAASSSSSKTYEPADANEDGTVTEQEQQAYAAKVAEQRAQAEAGTPSRADTAISTYADVAGR